MTSIVLLGRRMADVALSRGPRLAIYPSGGAFLCLRGNLGRAPTAAERRAFVRAYTDILKIAKGGKVALAR